MIIVKESTCHSEYSISSTIESLSKSIESEGATVISINVIPMQYKKSYNYYEMKKSKIIVTGKKNI